MSAQDKLIYQALALPNEALTNGGTEIMRAGIIDGELYVTARRAFKNPAKWGDVLAETARRIALLYSAEDTDLTEAEIRTDILEAFAADLGAKKIENTSKKKKASPARRVKSRKSAKRAPAKPKSVKRSKS
jgi:hypothetical protein